MPSVSYRLYYVRGAVYILPYKWRVEYDIIFTTYLHALCSGVRAYIRYHPWRSFASYSFVYGLLRSVLTGGGVYTFRDFCSPEITLESHE